MRKQDQYAIYFDWGGVIRSLHDDEMFDDIARTCGVSRNLVDEEWVVLGSRMTRGELKSEYFWYYAKKIGITLPHGYSHDELFVRTYRERSELNQPVVDLVNRLKVADFTVGLLTNTIWPHYNFFTEEPEWSQYHLFNPVIASPLVEEKKGDPGHYIYRKAAAEVPQNAIFFADDSKRYALDIPTELNARPGAVKRWIGIWTPDFDRVAPTIEEALRKEGLDF